MDMGMEQQENVMTDQFDDNSFYIPDAGEGISVCGHKVTCNNCNRKILIQLPLIGEPHHLDAMAICAECLNISDDFIKDHPEIAKNLKEWKDGC